MTIVAAALLENDGFVLICQRRAGQAHPLKWEFPGGKVEPGETPDQALRRELREELGIEAEIGAEITRYEYVYPGKQPIVLIFYHVQRFQGQIRNVVFEQIRWESFARLPEYDFLEGDTEFVRDLSRSYGRRIVTSRSRLRRSVSSRSTSDKEA